MSSLTQENATPALERAGWGSTSLDDHQKSGHKNTFLWSSLESWAGNAGFRSAREIGVWALAPFAGEKGNIPMPRAAGAPPHPGPHQPGDCETPIRPESGLLNRSPASQRRMDSGEWIGDHIPTDEIPTFRSVPHIFHTNLGLRNGGPEGAVLRFDGGRMLAPGKAVDDHWGAMNTLAWGQQHGFNFITIAVDGTIFLPANFDWLSWGPHIGCDAAQDSLRAEISRRFVSIEINNPGPLYPTPDPDCFVPWFNAVRDDCGDVRLNAYGEARCLDRRIEWYRRKDVAIIPHSMPGLSAGVYVPMPSLQRHALKKTLLWLKRSYPGTFSINRIISAAEIKCGKNRIDDNVTFITKERDVECAIDPANFRAELRLCWSDERARLAQEHFNASAFSS